MNIKDAILNAVLRERKRLFKIGRSELVLDDVDKIIQIIEKVGLSNRKRQK